jgi:hypothetical protein
MEQTSVQDLKIKAFSSKVFKHFFYYSILFSLLIYFDDYDDDDDVVDPRMYFVFVENVAKLNILHERKFVTLSVFYPLALV